MSAPERIWANEGLEWHSFDCSDVKAGWTRPYILATPAALAASPEVAKLIREAEARGMERDAVRRNLRVTFEAMCAMRDAINEYIPMPSLESDLLQGPENSVFCTVVAQSVVAELAAAQQREADSDLCLVWSHEHGCWWRPDSAGYTNDARAAGVYTRAEAISISHRGRDGWREGTKPDELAVRLSDMPEWVRAALSHNGRGE